MIVFLCLYAVVSEAICTVVVVSEGLSSSSAKSGIKRMLYCFKRVLLYMLDM